MNLKPILPLLCLGITPAMQSCSDKSQNASRPNIILIMADDIGFSDIGCYGSEIMTPNLDGLAQNGLRFQSFYNMAKCNPTRSSLLTGLYTGGNGAVHIADLTRQAGYFNIMSGKEHFDEWVPEYCKAENVFDHSLYFWATTEYFLPPGGEFERPFFLEGKELNAAQIEYEKSPMYKTDFITDYAMKWLDEAFTGEQPFFLYLPYHAAHYPLQARPEDIAKYRGKYKKGWDELRIERFEKMKEIGIIDEKTILSPPEGNINRFRGPDVPAYSDYYPWETLSEEQKDSLDLEMAVFAAMIDRMDQNIGRVINKLKENNKLENTLIMFLVDNGSCPYYANKITDVQPGPANSYWSLRANWANLGNTPFRFYKQYGHEGGSHTPFIAHWPGVIKPNTITSQTGHIVDIEPTLLDILKIDYPDSIHGYATIPLHGTSLLPVFKDQAREEPEYFISGLDRHRMFRMGDWKIVRVNKEEWQLYNIKEDPSETHDLSVQFPEKLKEMELKYEEVWADLSVTD
ncbi:MAG: arylsulfatase [Bacteroidales bacterium]|nr:arylsulfatase [Bacteroidales bacterium]MCF8389735.1 arylsulfatase [Bacteroidales bacterium]